MSFCMHSIILCKKNVTLERILSFIGSNWSAWISSFSTFLNISVACGVLAVNPFENIAIAHIALTRYDENCGLSGGSLSNNLFVNISSIDVTSGSNVFFFCIYLFIISKQ